MGSRTLHPPDNLACETLATNMMGLRLSLIAMTIITIITSIDTGAAMDITIINTITVLLPHQTLTQTQTMTAKVMAKKFHSPLQPRPQPQPPNLLWYSQDPRHKSPLSPALTAVRHSNIKVRPRNRQCLWPLLHPALPNKCSKIRVFPRVKRACQAIKRCSRSTWPSIRIALGPTFASREASMAIRAPATKA